MRFLLLILLSSIAIASPQLSDRQQLEELYRQIDKAYVDGNPTGIAAIALSDAKVGTPERLIPIGAFLDAFRAARQTGVKFRSRSELIQVTFSASEATATVRVTATQFRAGAEQRMVQTSRDIWLRTAGGWKLKESVASSARYEANATDPDTAKKVAVELRQRASPLHSTKADDRFDDLEAFGRAIGQARIIALGEATHGTKEFFQIKHRLLRYLVERKGFTVFAIEGNWPEALAADRYIKTGEGSAREALGSMYFWTWQTHEVLQMIEWMRNYNRARGKKPALTFTGFDMQTPDLAARRVLEYFKRYSPSYVPIAERWPTQSAEIVNLFDGKRFEFTKTSPVSAFRDARQAAEIVRQAMANRQQSRSDFLRDEMMARNVEWLAHEAHAGEKIVLWAHNGHVSFAEDARGRMMGGWLKQRFGDSFYVVGFAFRRGTVRAVGKDQRIATHNVPPSPEGSGDAVLGAAGYPLFFLDMRSVPRDSVLGVWLGEQHLHVGCGASWSGDVESHMAPLALRRAYEGLIFVEETNAAEGLQ